MSADQHPAPSNQRLTRVQQLTLNTWRLAAAKLDRVVDPCSVLELAAVHGTLGALRDVQTPLDLFCRHSVPQPEFALIESLMRGTHHDDLTYDNLDTDFLIRLNELVADGAGPEELPPLRRQRAAVELADERTR
jgi:hypothetical protein